ncbi:methyltransferase, FkbM family [Streptomyces sp. DvalAA-14]|uniref:FkbM family methyltransferase n=1 Tax=unclassified Streptomyces TaxID=2593676 RepID=UPI00081BAD43|nr:MULTISPECIES: FkbM family methyltransferase [unclassified Streptomyces]MYS22582.1 FkbM family methyltransferase [Streptomyces sp. SID4948]SCE18743.1 methyltransferase, FkbM family [Streptomyces sp. DvalAA-14]
MSNPTSEALVTLGRWYVRNAPGTLAKAPLADFLNPRLRDEPRRRVVGSAVGPRFAVDTQDLIQRYVYLFGVWEPRMTQWLKRRLRPGDTFVDVGANIGYFSVLASQLVGPEGKVVAIEASRAFQDRLAQNARLNGCTNIRAVHTAVSDKQQTLTFILASSNNMGANSIVPYDGPAESTFDIEAFPLPDVLEEDEIAKARVIKVDVEGAEGSAVRGMAPLLDRLRPDAEITVEVTPERMAQLGDSVEELLETMRGAGFHVYRLANEYAPASYPAALSGASAVPVRWRGPVTGESDLIFSRIDAETLP